MPFEEWFTAYNKNYGLPPAHFVARDAWNAAIEEALEEVKLAACHGTPEAHMLEVPLEALKTPLEAPET